MNAPTLGEPTFASPISPARTHPAYVPVQIVRGEGAAAPADGPTFELAGPMSKLYFDPVKSKAGIVTCGGLCPGLNNVIRAIFLTLHHTYGVPEVLGFRLGYQGLDPQRAVEPIRLDCDFVNDIHKQGGTVLGTSRGPVDVAVAVDNLVKRGVNMLFTIGGDGTQRGGNALFQEARKRGHALAVVGVPKTIDNDVPFVARTFGFQTAVEEAVRVVNCAHMEARSVENGVSLIKVMGRHAGYIAAGTAIASGDVNFALVPEVPLKLGGERGFLAVLRRRIIKRGHAVIVCAEGAGQELLAGEPSAGRDASGNEKLRDIGPWLRGRIEADFKTHGVPLTMRYIDPSYIIRSVPADAEDAVLCDVFARCAVHAAMAGRTGVVIGQMHDQFILVPIEMLTSQHKRIDPAGPLWQAVVATTGQPASFE